MWKLVNRGPASLRNHQVWEFFTAEDFVIPGEIVVNSLRLKKPGS